MIIFLEAYKGQMVPFVLYKIIFNNKTEYMYDRILKDYNNSDIVDIFLVNEILEISHISIDNILLEDYTWRIFF